MPEKEASVLYESLSGMAALIAGKPDDGSNVPMYCYRNSSIRPKLP